jgi:hypothetical protein
LAPELAAVAGGGGHLCVLFQLYTQIASEKVIFLQKDEEITTAGQKTSFLRGFKASSATV